MAGDDDINEADRQALFARLEKLGIDRVKQDLLNGGYKLVGGPPAVRDLAWEWVRKKEAELAEAAKKDEIIKLNPGAWGMSVNLKEGARWVWQWIRRRYKGDGP